MLSQLARNLLAILLALLCLATGARAAVNQPTQPAKAARPTESIEQSSCVTADCHANIKSFKTAHAPVVMNACDTCHELTSAREHTFSYPRKDAAMCTYCHEFDVEGVPVVHTPVAKGECTGCHDPHGGQDRRMTREASVKETCARCHEDITEGHASVHKPVADGACDSCHTSHASKFPKLLYAEGNTLCFSCHQEFQSQVFGAKFQHEAINEGCSSCHATHASPVAKQLRQPITDLCNSCHDEVKAVSTTSRYKHSALSEKKACITCHAPHAGDHVRLMNDVPVKLCMNCHKEKIKTTRGYVVAALPELADPRTIKHGPINDGQCGACHEVHGSDHTALLVKLNAGKLYQPLAEDNYKLCFTCHDSRLGQDQFTDSATLFRNGPENLHFIHVNAGERGRNCKVCHSTHASHSPRHVNDFLQYGAWKMPIAFKETTTGGTCTPGCHEPYSYDRIKPVARPTTRPTTRPTPPPVFAASATSTFSAPPREAPLKWSLTSADGKPLTVPDPDRPTVLLFSRPAHAQQSHLLRLVEDVLRDTRRARVILILAGPGATDDAKRLTESKSIPCPVVADEKEKLFNQLEVHVWPTTLVVRPDGTQAARVAGAPESLPVSLSAYLDFASGKIDRAAMADRIKSGHAIANDTPAKQAIRHLQSARRLLAAGNADAARKELESSLALNPSLIPAQVELIKVLTRLGRVADATARLEKLPVAQLASGERDLLRAHILIKQSKWTPARQALAAAAAQGGPASEIHYLTGQIHERQGNSAAAAEAYRRALESERK